MRTSRLPSTRGHARTATALTACGGCRSGGGGPRGGSPRRRAGGGRGAPPRPPAPPGAGSAPAGRPGPRVSAPPPRCGAEPPLLRASAAAAGGRRLLRKVLGWPRGPGGAPQRSAPGCSRCSTQPWGTARLSFQRWQAAGGYLPKPLSRLCAGTVWHAGDVSGITTSLSQVRCLLGTLTRCRVLSPLKVYLGEKGKQQAAPSSRGRVKTLLLARMLNSAFTMAFDISVISHIKLW